MLDQISFHYKTKRTNFGRPTAIFEDTNTRIFLNVDPDLDLREKYEALNPFSIGIQASVTYSSHSVNTEVTQTKIEDVLHKEGGWPQGIDPTNAPSCKQTRSKLEKKENFLSTLRDLSTEAEKTLKLNVSIDLYSDHFKQGEDQSIKVADPSMRTLSILRDKFENRLVSSISWSSESASSQSRRVAICYTPKDMSCPTAHYESFIYNLECPSIPEFELHPPSPLMCLEYNTKDSNFLVGGMSHGSLSLWDIRQGSLPVWTSAIESSHRGSVNAVRWISSKTAFECVSVSADGNAMTWDTRSNTSPLETIQLTPNPESLPEGFAPPFGGRCLDYHTGVPTKYMVGTVEGLVMGVNRKAADPSTRISGVFPGHYGPVYAVRRHPTETKYFCSVSDWGCRFFTEDNKTPLMSIPAQRNYLMNAVWGLARTTVVYTGNTVGEVDAWDLIQSLCVPVCSISVGKNPIYSMAIESSGQFLLTGDSEGTSTLLEINEPLRNITQTEKSLFNGMMGRESKRVKNYDQFIKEQKMREKAKANTHKDEVEPKEEKPFDPEQIEREFDAALKGEKEVVVEKKRVVIGDDGEPQAEAPTLETSVNVVAKGIIGEENSQGDNEETNDTEKRQREEGKLDDAFGGVTGGLLGDNNDESKLENGVVGNIIKEAHANKEEEKEDEAKLENGVVRETIKEAHANKEEEKEDEAKLENGIVGNIIKDAHANKEEEKEDEAKLENGIVGNTIKEAHANKEEEKEDEAKLENGIVGNTIKEAHANKEEEDIKETPKLENGIFGSIIKDAHANKEQNETETNESDSIAAERELSDENSVEKESPKLQNGIMGSIIKETHENKEKDGASLNNALDNFTSALTGDQNQDDTNDKQDDQIEEKQVENESNEIDNKLERGLMGNIIKDAYANKENDEIINDEVEKSDTDFVGESDFEKDSSAVENSNQEENDAEEKKESPKIEAGLFGNILADAHANKVEDEQTEEPIPESSNNESTDKEAASNNESEKKEESPKLQAGIFGNIVAEAHANKVEDEPRAEENNDETTSETVTRESNEDSSKEDNQAKDDSPKLGAGLMGNIIADAYANKAQDESNANDSAVENERSTTDDNSTNNKKEDDQNNRGDGKLDNAMNSVAGGLLG